MIELMNAKYRTSRAGNSYQRVRGVALLTIMRETMIALSTKNRSIYLIAAILVIGFVFWIVASREKSK
jgi:uncharacterized membrane protein (DUF373 family)